MNFGFKIMLQAKRIPSTDIWEGEGFCQSWTINYYFSETGTDNRIWTRWRFG